MKLRYILRFLLIILSVVLIGLGILFYKAHPLMVSQAVSCAETLMLNSANEAVIKVLSQDEVSYEDIVRLSVNEQGYVTSLETNAYNINSFKSRISKEISEIIAKKEYYSFGIPIGSFFGNDFTVGFGPRIKFKMQVTTTAFVDFSHEFKGAGINQVLHLVNVDIKINGSLTAVGYNKGVSVATSAVAAQTVIVGKTPEAFTNVIESETDNTGGLINDYGADSKQVNYGH